MKTYVGTTLAPDEFRAFAIRAASLGLSKSAYLKKLTLEALRRAKALPAKEEVQ